MNITKESSFRHSNRVIRESSERETYKTILYKRVDNLILSIVDEMAKSEHISRVLTATDNGLMNLIFQYHTASLSGINERERRKLKRETEGTIRFYEHLQKLGGTLKASQVAERLKITRQTVNNYAKNGKLLAVKPAKESVFPLFQFDENGVIPHFEEVLFLLPKEMGVVSKVSFFTSMHFFEDKTLSVIDVLKMDDIPDYCLREIRHQANLFGHQISA
ncbi:helix-turn-helix domain-containing protein [Photorhabdus khanii]|uniref:DNA-binding protein n=1 Tax=Photorhabdus khanii subsp. guanajuatensis TaxID=2100166 RepID=A0A4R4ITE2_9GAMM|nr:helix-turn-helix domain-containing protein [Photorhabdus khanii]TDB44044.1 DNA-binding protein [Photorhabdus khanii subsp. guanajuatensis]